MRDLGAGHDARGQTSSLTPFDCEENLSERPRSGFVRPIPLRLAQDLNPARWSRAGLDHALERCSMCLDECAADRIHAAFDGRLIRQGIVVAEANYIACQTWIEGTFVREFTESPAGALVPNGRRVVWDLANIFRLDHQGRLIEEWVRTDYRSFLRQLGAPGK